MFKADFHIHTLHSYDCGMSLEAIIDRCLKTGINCIAISDHSTITGALKMQEIAPFPVIIAEEILTPHGEVMGLFLEEEIPSGQPLAEVISRIKAQGALVGLPHPFDPFRGLKLSHTEMEKLATELDFIEVFNARSPFPRTTTKAQDFARKCGIAATAGSDAHTPGEIGRTFIEMPEFSGKDDFLEALKGGQINGRRSSLLVHLSSTWTKLKKR